MTMNLFGHWTGIVILVVYMILLSLYVSQSQMVPVWIHDMFSNLGLRVLGLVVLVLLLEYPLMRHPNGKLLGVIFALALTYSAYMSSVYASEGMDNKNKIEFDEKMKQDVQHGPGEYAMDTKSHPSEHMMTPKEPKEPKTEETPKAPDASGGSANHSFGYSNEDRPTHKAMSENAFEGIDSELKGKSAEPEMAPSNKLFQAEKGM